MAFSLIPPHFAQILSNRDTLYFMMNLAAASCVLLGLSVDFNLASALIQIFWVVMSLVGICVTLMRPKRRVV